MTSPAPAPPVSIRTAGAADLPTVFRLVGALLAELGEEGDEAGALDVAALAALHRELDGRHVALLAETAPGHAIGVLTLYEAFAIYANGKYGVISEMYVAPGFRGARVGGALLGAAQAHGRQRGWRRLDVCAPENERWRRARQFYQRHGFAYAGPKLRRLL